MASASDNSTTTESSFVENDERMTTAVEVPTNKQRDSIITVEGDEFPVVERGIKGTVVSFNRMKHFGFIKRKDKATARDLFARDLSIINDRNRKLFVGDVCRFDIIKNTRGFEAINIFILERNVTPVRKLPKIPKKPEVTVQQSQVPGDVFRSTMAELFRLAMKKN